VEAFELGADAVLGERARDLSRDEVVDLTRAVEQDGDEREQEDGGDERDARDHGVAARDVAATPARSARRGRRGVVRFRRGRVRFPSLVIVNRHYRLKAERAVS
jgi:hypothetical protein